MKSLVLAQCKLSILLLSGVIPTSVLAVCGSSHLNSTQSNLVSTVNLSLVAIRGKLAGREDFLRLIQPPLSSCCLHVIRISITLLIKRTVKTGQGPSIWLCWERWPGDPGLMPHRFSLSFWVQQQTIRDVPSVHLSSSPSRKRLFGAESGPCFLV